MDKHIVWYVYTVFIGTEKEQSTDNATNSMNLINILNERSQTEKFTLLYDSFYVIYPK